ncbi:hypothetical protein ACXR2T_07130 [Leucobacter sp. HY1910]
MLNFAQISPRLFDEFEAVITELIETVSMLPEQVLIVGAGCRDILHAALGHDFLLRATNDVDIGIALDDWAISDRIDDRFQRLGSNGIRYRIGGLPVDIMPFGAIEDPTGISTPAPRGEGLVVFAFSEVHQQSLPLKLPSGITVRIPTITGYALLKLRSWVDRSVYGEDKDAKDLALAAFWYREAQEVQDNLYSTDEGQELLEEAEWDIAVAAARQLGIDAGLMLGVTERVNLAEQWDALDHDKAARSFVLPPGSPGELDEGCRAKVVAALNQGLQDSRGMKPAA